MLDAVNLLFFFGKFISLELRSFALWNSTVPSWTMLSASYFFRGKLISRWGLTINSIIVFGFNHIRLSDLAEGNLSVMLHFCAGTTSTPELGTTWADPNFILITSSQSWFVLQILVAWLCYIYPMGTETHLEEFKVLVSALKRLIIQRVDGAHTHIRWWIVFTLVHKLRASVVIAMA